MSDLRWNPECYRSGAGFVAECSQRAADCGVKLHEMKLEELKWGYIPHRVVAYGEAEALHAFSQALLYSDLWVGNSACGMGERSQREQQQNGYERNDGQVDFENDPPP